MKLNNQSQLSRISRATKMASIGGLIGLTFLANAAIGQDEAPGAAPFSLLEEAAGSAIEMPPADIPLEQPPASSTVWEPPTTPVETAPQWNPPQTPVEPQIPEPSLSSVTQTLPSDTSVMEVAPQVDLPETSVSTTPNVLPLPSATPQIPDTAELPVQIEAGPDLLGSSELTLDSQFELQEVPGEFSENFESVITGEVMDEPFLDSSEPFLDSSEQFESVATEEGLANAVREPRVVNLPFRTPVRDALGGVGSILGSGNESVHATGQLTFLSLSRDYRGRGRLLSNGIPNLFANGPDEGNFTGVDINYGRRAANGRGWELRFFGFDPGSETDVAGASPTLAWGGVVEPFASEGVLLSETFGLSSLGLNGISMSDVFNNAGNHRVVRDSEFGSFEFNLLRASAGGSRLSCGNASVEFFGGLRAVTFEETIAFSAGATPSATVPNFPRSASYLSEVKNHLFGLQIGARLQRQQANGWGYTFGSRVGIYNNRIESRQSAAYQFDDGSSSTPQILFGNDAGRDFDFDGKDNELAFLGELDFGVVYQFRPQVRARVGYRGVVITNVADAAGQFEDNLFDVEAVAEPKAFSDFVVGGLYFGVDYAF